jgi:mRNA-degrading endonuclease YafQ of YafQ-DinJ toxin-antitoxin module
MGGTQSQPTAAGVAAKFDPAKVDAVTQNIESAIDLLKRYNKGNIQEFYTHITQNSAFSKDLDSLDPTTRAKLEKYIASLGNIETNSKFTAALQSHNLQSVFKEEQGAKFTAQIEGLRKDIDPKLFSEAEEFAKQLAEVTSREKYFKYYYLLTQLWLIVYVRRMSAAVVDFTNTTINLFNITEQKRNESTSNLLKKLLALLKIEQGDINEQDFKFFKDSMVKFETDIATSTAQLREGLEKAKGQLSDKTKVDQLELDKIAKGDGLNQGALGTLNQGQSDPYLAQRQQNRGGSRQDGGFVRDGSRFPESFYAEPTQLTHMGDQFGGQSFAKLDKQ